MELSFDKIPNKIFFAAVVIVLLVAAFGVSYYAPEASDASPGAFLTFKKSKALDTTTTSTLDKTTIEKTKVIKCKPCPVCEDLRDDYQADCEIDGYTWFTGEPFEGKGNCCGDDTAEYWLTSVDGYFGCCNAQTDCVHDITCYSSDTKISSSLMCYNGVIDDCTSGSDLGKNVGSYYCVGWGTVGWSTTQGNEYDYSNDYACTDGYDNDADGLTDCADPDCQITIECAVCGDGVIGGSEGCDDGVNNGIECVLGDDSLSTCMYCNELCENKLKKYNFLIADTYNLRVIEVDTAGNAVWEKTGLDRPRSAERLSNGNTLIADYGNNRVIEVDTAGNAVWQKTVLYYPRSAERLSNGNTLIADAYNNRVIEVDTAGNVIWQKTGLNYPMSAERLSNGNTLIADSNNHRVIEVDTAGNAVWTKTGLNNPNDVERLSNGNTLIADYGNNRVIEVDTAGNIIWEKTGLDRPGDAKRIEIDRLV